ncbi:MAG: XdhC family protein [Oscillibacter sp.]|jgi:xanthine dehydrogenase accessory factor|nr:XdhC family protein [Oscillibacter sp.]
MRELLNTLCGLLSSGRDAVLCRIISASGSTPRGSGAAMAVAAEGCWGTVGGGAGEHAAQEKAAELLRTRRSCVRSYEMGAGGSDDVGMICGGGITVAFQFLDAGDGRTREVLAHAAELAERDADSWLITRIGEGTDWETGTYEPTEGVRYLDGIPEDVRRHLFAPRSVFAEEDGYFAQPLGRGGTVYVFGGGHVALELVPLLVRVGFRTAVYEDRPEFADPARFPQAERIILGEYREAGVRLSIRPCDYAAVMTRGHAGDCQVLEQVLRTPAAYVGCIGSRRKHGAVCERLRAAGIPEADIARIHNPIGLPILAQTPEEIAVSIAAELIRERALLRD